MKKAVAIMLTTIFITSSIKAIYANNNKFYHNGHTYEFIDYPMTWTEAKEYCENLGGHLVTITSNDEWKFLHNIIINSGKQYWLGASDANIEGNWQWVTGEHWSYADWCENEPNNDYNGTEDYLGTYTNTYQWNDYRNNEVQYVLCEWEKKPYSFSYKGVRYTSISNNIEKNDIVEDKDISITKFKPLEGASKAIMGNDIYTPDNNDPLIIGNDKLNNISTAFDAIDFLMSFISNSMEITRLHLYTNSHNEMILKYGSSIELNYSGKKVSLSQILVDKYYDFSPSIIFTSKSKADKCIRNWFELDGNGTYSMDFDFGNAYIGDYGYYLLIEDKEHIYTVPIIHKDTTMKVYYTENKKCTYLFDAADILRNTKIELSDEEREEIIAQLEKHDFKFQ